MSVCSCRKNSSIVNNYKRHLYDTLFQYCFVGYLKVLLVSQLHSVMVGLLMNCKKFSVMVGLLMNCKKICKLSWPELGITQ
jgi:hypothetical protein